jgi:putative pyruvate formate lyase activating enzyme
MPSYLSLHASGELSERVQMAYDLLSPCSLCPRICGADRLGNRHGVCRTGFLPEVTSYGPHMGEEAPLTGKNGSGTIFFTHCNLSCAYCQNYQISQVVCGRQISCESLAEMMLDLEDRQCHNINLVSPSHQVPQILKAVEIATSRGLTLPLVYNTGSYDSLRTLKILDGVIDIYMPDTKYADNQTGLALSGVPDYASVMKAALCEMHRQVGDLECSDGIAVRGMMIRHLVLPAGLAGTPDIMHFIASDLSRNSYVNIMPQYRPLWNVTVKNDPPEFLLMRRPVTGDEFGSAVSCARKEGLHRGF